MVRDVAGNPYITGRTGGAVILASLDLIPAGSPKPWPCRQIPLDPIAVVLFARVAKGSYPMCPEFGNLPSRCHNCRREY